MEIKYEEIGRLISGEEYKYEAPRQSTLANNRGVIKLHSGYNFEQALEDLEGFERIWVIYSFHLNSKWKPKVKPPRSPDGRKIGVFATRSPHRPNSIGMSCVVLDKIVGRNLHIRNFDLLNNTPVLDIKPYIPYCDSFPDSACGWLQNIEDKQYSFQFSDIALRKIDFIYKFSGLNIRNFVEVQLSHDPTSAERKRIFTLDHGRFMLGCRTWRIIFKVISDDCITICDVISSYSIEEMFCSGEDKYNDKRLHREFYAEFADNSA